MDINRLLEDISIRHACKNVSKYVADIEKAVGIKLVPAGDDGLEKDRILYYFRRQQPKMLFSVKDREISGHYRLSITFKFHPENAV